jgi:predicted outer membrane repeat protein
MTVGDSHSLALRCTFEGNTATGSGGGLSSGDSPLTVCRCVFRANNAGSLGGGIVNVQGDPIVTQCLFVDNISGGGGGFGNDDGDGDPHITGCTFHGNSGAVAGGIYNGGDDLVASGCIFWGNEGAEIWGSPDETLVTYSLLEDYWPGEGNICFADPQFVDEAGDDFRLAPGSPCIDAADNTAVPADEYDLDDDGDVDEPIPYDLDGNTRFVDDPETEDTGNGEPPIVDMGAYEYQVDSCPADFNDDGFVNAADLLFLLGAWGTPDGDVDDDDDTDAQDLLTLLGAWGECPG